MADWQQCAAGETAASRDPKRSIGHFSSGGFGVRYKLRGELYFTNDNGQFTASVSRPSRSHTNERAKACLVCFPLFVLICAPPDAPNVLRIRNIAFARERKKERREEKLEKEAATFLVARSFASFPL